MEKFFVVTDKELIEDFKKQGFKVMSESDGMVTFANNKNIKKSLYELSDKIVFTNRLNF